MGLSMSAVQNPCDVFGNGDRDDGEREGKKYLPDDNHAETSSTGKQAASLAWKVSFATYFPLAGAWPWGLGGTLSLFRLNMR